MYICIAVLCDNFLDATPYYNAFFGAGSGPIYLSTFRCNGGESRLINCSHGGLYMIDLCNGHQDDAGVRCGKFGSS